MTFIRALAPTKICDVDVAEELAHVNYTKLTTKDKLEPRSHCSSHCIIDHFVFPCLGNNSKITDQLGSRGDDREW